MSEQKHTPGPWACDGPVVYIGEPGMTDAVDGSPLWGGFNILNCPRPESNARHIVKCVNCHDELIEALKALLDRANHFNVSGVYFSEENFDVLQRAEDAIESATGEQQ